ncbi:Gfo/Idh/MocA family protein [Thermobaculum terrenum]|nr:Gfo/Idh/MocA family oxidoreductase [Thermobaculum terrenum]
MSKVRVGLIGLGEVAQIIHLPVLESLADRYEVRAICDVSQGLVKAMGDRYGVEGRYTDYRELVRRDDLDAVMVLSSDEYHTDAVLAALREGKHVFVEKPMCLTLREAEQIIQERDRSSRQVMVGYMRRYAPAFLEGCQRVRQLDSIEYVRVRDIIGENRLIIEQSSRVLRYDDVPRELVEDRRRRGEEMVSEAVGEGWRELYGTYRLLCGLSSHDLSAMRELVGMPKRVVGAASWRGGRRIVATLEFEGYVGMFETMVDEQRRFDAHLEVYGPRESIRVQYDTPYIRHLPTRLILCKTEGDEYREEVVRPTFKDPYTCEMEYFYEVVRRNETPKTSPEDFCQDLQLFQQIIQAIRQGGAC